jgi:hypothetical protein
MQCKLLYDVVFSLLSIKVQQIWAGSYIVIYFRIQVVHGTMKEGYYASGLKYRMSSLASDGC